MNRRLRTKVPIKKEKVMGRPNLPSTSLREKEESLRAKQKDSFHIHHGEIKPLDPGTFVWMPNRESEGVMTEEVVPRSYTVETQEGTYWIQEHSYGCQTESQKGL